MAIVRFNHALRLMAEATQHASLPKGTPVLVIRDVYGKLRFAINLKRDEYPGDAQSFLKEAMSKIGAFGSGSDVLFRDDLSGPDALFASPDWHETIVPANDGSVPVDPTTIQLLDRQIIGQAWLRPEQEDQKKHPFRIVFYGLKGGVGRSTTLALLAYRLARDGKKVLLIDFDLESPGLSGLLLPPERVAPFGLVDWFVEDAVGQGDSLLGELVADSPLADDLTGHIRIAAALGQGETAYLAKLARVYADVPTKTGPVRFPERMRKIVQLLEAKEKPDVVLIDSRAGLHDVAAVSIAGLASVALLFITDTPQNWLGYRQLFEHWQRRPEVLRMVRDRLVVVQALFPESDQARRAEQFLQRSYDLFSSTLYDEIDPSKSGDTEAFSFDENSEDAPHYPLRVRWSARLQEFDPLVSVRAGGVDLADIEISMGPFFGEILSLLDGE